MNINARTKICIIIGDPVNHSLSPAMHNAAYKKLGIDSKFVYLGANVSINNIKEAVEGVKAFGIRGLTCTMPHKIEIMKYIDEIDEIARKIGAVNTVVYKNGVLKGYNTDWLGVVIPLEKLTNLSGKKIAVLGAGGAARAIVYGLTKKKGDVIIFNRTLKKAKNLAEEFGCGYSELNDTSAISKMDIIINATSIGMKPMENVSPINADLISNKQIVFDIIYSPYDTKLLRIAKQKGARLIHGIDMLLYQGTAQFELYTDTKAPEKTMRKVLLENLIK